MITVALGSSAFSNVIGEREEITFEAFAEVLRTHWHVGKLPHGCADVEAVKLDKNTHWFSLAKFRAPERCNANVESLSGFVGDFDKGTWPIETVSTMLDMSGVRHLIYTTYSHSAACPKFRIVIPYAAAISVADHKRLWLYFNQMFGGGLDPAAKDEARLFYFPSCCADTGHLKRFELRDGAPFDVAALLPTLAPAPPEKPDRDSTEWTDAPCDGSVALSDEVLIRRMLESSGGPGVAFSGSVHVRDLFQANADVLGRAYPSPRHDAFDRSAADQGLANRLVFWTRGNCEQIERIMRSSKLAVGRDKYDRADGYLRSTILRAAADHTGEYYKGRANDAATMTTCTVPMAPVPAPPTDTAPAPTSSTALQLLPPTQAPHVLTFDSKNRYEATIPNILATLKSQQLAALGFDTFRGRVMIASTVTAPMQWRTLTDTHITELREAFERKGFAPVGKEMMRDALQQVAEGNSYDSATIWLNGLTWDGLPRVESFLSAYCGTVDDEYTRAVGRYIFTGLAARVYEPGCQLDMVVALHSTQQGLYKSRALQELAPDPEMFTDGLDLHDNSDNFKRLIRGKLVVEIAELAGLSKADVDQVKRAITRRYELWVEKWQTQESRYARRCMLFATTNNEQFLPKDDTGQRRWLPVEIGRIDRDGIKANREQLWAEGATRYRQIAEERLARGGVLEGGVDFQDAERLAAGRHAKHEQRDVWESEIERWLNEPIPGPNGSALMPPPRERPLTIPEVLGGALHMSTERMDAKAESRAGRVLRQLGYESVPTWIGGKTARRWVRRT